MMNKKIRLAASFIALAALLAACSGSKPAASTSADAVATPETPAVTDINTAAPSSAVTEETAHSPAPEETVTEETVTEETAKLYRMNEVYRFVPIDDEELAKAVLLTFDDGPKSEDIIVSMLDTLDKHGAKAIFFVNGYRVEQNPELLKLIYERGFTIGNHSWDHINLKNEDRAVIERQIGDVQAKVEELTGAKPLFFRPPYGSGNDLVKSVAKDHGMLYMTWSNGSLDWDKSAAGKPEAVIQNVLDQLHPGANILMHELQWTADALDELLTKLEEQGYRFIDPASIESIN